MSGFIAFARLNHDWADVVSKLSLEQYEKLRKKIKDQELLKQIPELFELFDVKKAKSDYHWFQEMLIDGEEAQAWSDAGIELQFKRIKGLGSTSPDIHQTIYQISVANVGLMQIERVEVLEDCCTDELQRWLDKKWRILAVCPPNDARRPSYIMGHFEKDAER